MTKFSDDGWPAIVHILLSRAPAGDGAVTGRAAVLCCRSFDNQEQLVDCLSMRLSWLETSCCACVTTHFSSEKVPKERNHQVSYNTKELTSRKRSHAEPDFPIHNSETATGLLCYWLESKHNKKKGTGSVRFHFESLAIWSKNIHVMCHLWRRESTKSRRVMYCTS